MSSVNRNVRPVRQASGKGNRKNCRQVVHPLFRWGNLGFECFDRCQLVLRFLRARLFFCAKWKVSAFAEAWQLVPTHSSHRAQAAVGA